MIISGAIIPIGVKNKNGWGILDSEIQNVIKTLKGKVLTVCPRNGDAHACDFDPKAEIGNIKDVWFDPFSKKIRTMAEITDSVAKQKISDGTWKPNWSVRLSAVKSEDGWAKDVEGKNVTIVPEGAWPDAKFNVLASKGDGFEVVLLAGFDIAPAPSDPIHKATVLKPIGTVSFEQPMNNSLVVNSFVADGTGTDLQTNGTFTVPYDPSTTIWVWPQPFVSSPNPTGNDKKEDDVLGGKQMADPKQDEKDSMVEQLKASLTERDQKITELEEKMKQITASIKEPEDVATKAKEIADQQIAAYKASLARDSAVKEYIAIAATHGIKEVDTKMFDGLTAEQVGIFTASLKAIKVPESDDDKLGGVKYPVTTPEEDGKLSVGIPELQPDGTLKWST